MDLIDIEEKTYNGKIYKNYLMFFKKLKEEMPEYQLISILADNIEMIIKSEGIYNTYCLFELMPTIAHYSNDDERIKKIDNAFASNINRIMNSFFTNYDFDFSYFENMEKFKEKIKEVGPDFFTKFVLDENISLNECERISNEIFGKFTSETFAKMKYGQNDKSKAKIIQFVLDELMEKSNGDISIADIEKIGEGYYSEVFKVGDYALKIGYGRFNIDIPNHRRILQPIIRMNIRNKNPLLAMNSNKNANYIEVQNLVDTNWWEKKTPEEIDEILLTVYSDIRSQGLIWTDVKYSNVGKLLKPNTSNLMFIDIDGKKREIKSDKQATGVIGDINEKPLEKGDYVIIDTDYIQYYDDYIKEDYLPGQPDNTNKFEKMYQDKIKNDYER